MMRLILVRPEIPPNTGNIIRLCANIGAHLHLVRPLGFSLCDATLRRAGLDYRQMANVSEHNTLAEASAAVKKSRLFALAPRRAGDGDNIGGNIRFDNPTYREGDGFVFGCESSGLPDAVLSAFSPQHRLYVPMRPGNRSINLSNTVAIVAMEAWRQLHYKGAAEY
ncbi:MAG: tRNA (cytidine(34)-2'-O)-methyltransferase [Gammaproteobacteria bacterium]